MNRVGTLAALAALALLVMLAGCKPKRAALPALGADISATSVSGLSSGAYMAGQFHIAHSSIVKGAGIVAGGPYGCAQSIFADTIPGPGAAFMNLSKAMNGCMLDVMLPSVSLLAERARKLADAGRIDSLAGVERSRVYLFSGTKDRTVLPTVVGAAASLYAGLGVPPASLKVVSDMPAGHAFITEDTGEACGRTAAPYLNDCDYDQAGDLLRHIYGSLKPKSAPSGEFIVFDQSEFAADLADHNLADAGVAYVPPGCKTEPGCRIHVAFHGCAQDQAKIGSAFILGTGFASWADSNRIIVLFPQVSAATVNPQACWDWWGYTGRDYLTQQGPQIMAVRRMLDRLAAEPHGGRSS